MANLMSSYLCLLLATTHIVSDVDSLTQTEQIDKVLKDLKINPEVLWWSPKLFANVTFPSGASAHLGNGISIADVQQKPLVIWPCHEKKLYTMIFTDIDYLIDTEPIVREWQAWFVHNIPGNEIEKGYEAFEYYPPPLLRQGPHRIVVTVFQQVRPINITKTPFPGYLYNVTDSLYSISCGCLMGIFMPSIFISCCHNDCQSYIKQLFQ